MAKEKKARVKERMQDMGEDVSDDDADEGKGRGKSGWDDDAGARTMLPRSRIRCATKCFASDASWATSTVG